jgi:hypothetical protein
LAELVITAIQSFGIVTLLPNLPTNRDTVVGLEISKVTAIAFQTLITTIIKEKISAVAGQRLPQLSLHNQYQ